MDQPANASKGPIPQHQDFPFPELGIRFTSQFDSGNIAKVEAQGEDTFCLWTAPDCANTAAETKSRTWFYFKVEVERPRQALLVIKHLNQQGKLFREGLRPVYKLGAAAWQQFTGPVTWRSEQKKFDVSLQTYLEVGEVSFAFCYPWSLEDSYRLSTQLVLEATPDCYVNLVPLIHTPEGRVCELLTISSMDGLTSELEPKLPNLFPSTSPRACMFDQSKPIVFISARVHPGETPGSHMLNGFLKFVVSADIRAQELRKRFVFKVIPVLNPDGVFRGYYRSDTFGENLNRVYLAPSLAESPTVYAARELMTAYCREGSERVYAYLDLHGHAAKQGVFVYGNYMDFIRQVDSFMFSRLMALNCVNFDFVNSSFSEKNMTAKDKGDGKSKEGSGRVAFFKLLGLVRSYTLEANYATGKVLNAIAVSPLDTDPASLRDSAVYSDGPPQYNIEILEDVGKAIGVSLLDSIDANPESRLTLTEFSNLRGLKADVAKYVAKLPPFRFDPTIRKADGDKLMGFIDNKSMTVNKEESKEKPKRTANKRKIKELARPRFDMRSRRQDVRTEEAKKTETVKKTEEAEIGKLNVRFMRQRKEMSVVSPSFDLNCGKVDRKGSLLRSRNARSLSQHRQIRPLGKPSMSQVLEKEGS
jgi:hypothetical protein